MKKEYQHLIGIDWDEQEHNCYTLVQTFYREIFDVTLDDFANPKDWWNKGLDLYIDNYKDQGFQVLECNPRDYQFGDIILMSLQSYKANHIAIILEDGQILHHLYGQRSCVTSYGGTFRNNTMNVFRHKDVRLRDHLEVLSLAEVLPINVRRNFERQRARIEAKQ